MSFMGVAVGIVGEGIAASILAGGMMSATIGGVSNLVRGEGLFDNLGQNLLLGGVTGGIGGAMSGAAGAAEGAVATTSGSAAVEAVKNQTANNAFIDATMAAEVSPYTAGITPPPVAPPVAAPLTPNGVDYGEHLGTKFAAPDAPPPPAPVVAAAPSEVPIPDPNAGNTYYNEELPVPKPGTKSWNLVESKRATAPVKTPFLDDPMKWMKENKGQTSVAVSSTMREMSRPPTFTPPAAKPQQYYKTTYNPGKQNPNWGKPGNTDPYWVGQGYGPGTVSTTYAAEGGGIKGLARGGEAFVYKGAGSSEPNPFAGLRGEKPRFSRDIYSDSDPLDDYEAPYSDEPGAGIHAKAPKGVSAKDVIAAYKAAGKKRKLRELLDPNDIEEAAQGGLMSLNTYAAGGRLLRGPGDGVSDSIPAVIQGQRPQRAALADGEFVLPARIVSEIGNGSTEAGAKRLYAMMDRIARARTKTVGKNNIAVDSMAHKMLPA